MAEHVTEVGIARRISTAEALVMLDMAEEEAMVLQPNNAREPFYLCCCSCCPAAGSPLPGRAR